jgi:hypothetical protein
VAKEVVHVNFQLSRASCSGASQYGSGWKIEIKIIVAPSLLVRRMARQKATAMVGKGTRTGGKSAQSIKPAKRRSAQALAAAAGERAVAALAKKRKGKQDDEDELGEEGEWEEEVEEGEEGEDVEEEGEGTGGEIQEHDNQSVEPSHKKRRPRTKVFNFASK